jgi:purine-binding chemotaxis protein CheW
MRLSADLINGIGKQTDDFVVILNVDRVFSEDDLSIAREHFEAAAGGLVHEEPVQESAAAAG